MAQSSSSKCQICSQDNGSVFCYECKQSLCLPCRIFHDQIPLTKTHKIVDLNKVDRLVYRLELNCSKHNGLLFTFFCTLCECLICSTCVISDHKGHPFSSVEEIVNESRQNSEAFLSKTEQECLKISGEIEKLKSGPRQKIQKDTEAVISDINDVATVLRGIVDLVKDVTVNKVNDCLSLEESQIDATLKEMETMQLEYRNARTTFDNLLKETHDITFFQSYTTNKKLLADLDDIREPQYPELEDVEKFDIEKFLVSVLLKMKERYQCMDSVIKQISEKDEISVEVKEFSDIKYRPQDEDFKCPICLDSVYYPKVLSCGHIFCKGCLDGFFKEKPVCPCCGTIYGVLTGNQPPGTMKVRKVKEPLAGYPDCGSIVIEYEIYAGKQEACHPNPGMVFEGIRRLAYLPDNEKGRLVADLLKIAFDRKQVFTIGTSRSTGKSGVVTWNGIHHKTNPKPNTEFGYPDSINIDRVLDELAEKGVTVKDLENSKV